MYDEAFEMLITISPGASLSLARHSRTATYMYGLLGYGYLRTIRANPIPEGSILYKMGCNSLNRIGRNMDSHHFAKPTSEASRAPCPALNSLANHGYL